MTAYHHHAAIRALFTKSATTSVAKHSAMGLTHALWACAATRSSLEKREVDSKAEVDGS